MADELGLVGRPRYVGKIGMRDVDSLKFVALFRFTSDYAEISEPDHIQELRFWPIHTLQQEVRVAPDAFTPTFLQLFSFYMHEGEGRRR